MIPLVESDSEVVVREFEERFAELVNCRWAVAVCSGTAALEVALRVLEREQVLIPSYGCVAVLNACEHLDSTPIFYDSSWDIRAASMTADVAFPDVLVHMFGLPTGSPGAAAVEDYTLSLGGVPRLRGMFGVCSTHASKMLSTGRGGVIFGNHYEDEVRDLACYDNVNPARQGAFSYAMSSAQAELGLTNLRKFRESVARRFDLAFRYSLAFDSAGIECPDTRSIFGGVFFRYLIAVDDPAGKVAALAERGIEAGRGVFPPLHRLAGLPDDDFPGTMDAVNSLLSVPVHPSITDEQAIYIADTIVEVCAP